MDTAAEALEVRIRISSKSSKVTSNFFQEVDLEAEVMVVVSVEEGKNLHQLTIFLIIILFDFLFKNCASIFKFITVEAVMADTVDMDDNFSMF